MSSKMKETVIRLWILFLGLVIAHLGVTLFLLAGQGSDPFNVLIQGLHSMVIRNMSVTPTHGTVHMIISFLIIVILLLVDRKYVRVGTLVCMFCGGPIIDFFQLAAQRTGHRGSGTSDQNPDFDSWLFDSCFWNVDCDQIGSRNGAE